MFESKSASQRRQWRVEGLPICLQWKQRRPPDGLTHIEVPLDKIRCKYDDLSQVVMPEEDHCLRMMRAEHLWHERFDHFDIWISLRCVLCLISSFSSNGAWGEDDYSVTSMCMPLGSSLFHEPCTTRTCTISRVSGSKCLLDVTLAAISSIRVAILTLQSPCRRGS